MSSKTTLVERLLLVSMLLISLGLIGLQYKWSNDLAAAELSVAEDLFNNQAQALGQEFDLQLSADCSSLIPTADEIEVSGIEAANLKRMTAWENGKHRPVFSRIGIVVPQENGARLFLFDPKSGQLRQSTPPPGWEMLSGFMEKRHEGGPPPFSDWGGKLIAYPVFKPRELAERGPRPEIQWTILEWDMEYLKNTWFPDLLGKFLSTDSADIQVASAREPSGLIFSTEDQTTNASISVPFNLQGRSPQNSMWPKNPVWTLKVWPNMDKLHSVIAKSRYQGLFLAFLLDGLILFAVYLLVRYTRRSRQLAEAQMNFVAATSHELRTPLTVIRGAAHNLERGIVTDPSRIKEYAGLIMRNAEDLTKMIEQVLTFATARQTRLQLNLVSLELGPVLKQSVDSLRTEIETHRITLEDSTLNVAATVSGDEASLIRAFQNLIGNAIKHAGDGGWIGVEVNVISLEEAVEVIIADRGPGIPTDEINRIFEPFYRSAETVAKQTRGSGIGLGVVKEIILAHKGMVTARNRPGGGAEFIVRLPLATTKS